MNKDLDYYLNLDWTLIEGTDLDFNGNLYHYLEIKEIPSFVFCAKTREQVLSNYKRQLRLSLMLMLEDGDEIIEPSEFDGFDEENNSEEVQENTEETEATEEAVNDEDSLTEENN